ncbi:leucine-rich repeat-containing protein 38-like [Drosophila tropicalis]|uniref:leucine-rich repeat-containing protein 38-like n=1 Tax=Drosophila tropicalis TaxID=46794 RepID=UPI0035ABB18F
MGSLETFPVIPVQIVGDSSLLLNDNRIEALPTSSLRNSSLGELHLKNISLTHLHLDQLPSNLKVLDIRDNNLTGLDDDVTQFISQLRKVQLSGNPWQCDCKFTKFLDYLRRENPNEYKVALRNCSGQGQCPEQCTCCKDSNSLKFIDNCSENNIF